jgi:hypothetical protein
MLMISCSEEQPTKINSDVEIIAISHGRYYGECIGYCERILEIYNDSTSLLLKGWDQGGSKIPDTIYRKFQTTIELWETLNKSFLIDSFFNLDSVDYSLGSLDEGYTWINVKTNLSDRTFSFNESDSIDVISSLNSILWNLRNQSGIDRIIIKH